MIREKNAMRHILAIFGKQLKDTLKNKAILIQFLMFPMMTLIMENTIKLDNMPPNFFAQMYAVMLLDAICAAFNA